MINPTCSRNTFSPFTIFVNFQREKRDRAPYKRSAKQIGILSSLHRRNDKKNKLFPSPSEKSQKLPSSNYLPRHEKERREINPRNRRNIIGNESEKKKKKKRKRKKPLKGEYFKNADRTLSFRFHGTYISWAEKQGERRNRLCLRVRCPSLSLALIRTYTYLALLVQMQSAAYVSVKKDSYRRALECNSVCCYSYLALLEFKLGGWLLRQASTLNRRTSSSRLLDNDQRRRCTLKGRSAAEVPFHRIPLYHSTVFQREEGRAKGRANAGR